MSHNYYGYQYIILCEITTVKDLYDLFGDTIEVRDDKGNVLPNYLKNKYNKRNGWNNN